MINNMNIHIHIYSYTETYKIVNLSNGHEKY